MLQHVNQKPVFNSNWFYNVYQAHTWSNLVLKKMKTPSSQTMGSQVVAPVSVQKSDLPGK